MKEPFIFEPQAFLDRAQSMLLREPEGPRAPGDPVMGDHRLPGYDPGPERLAAARPAAVLAPIILRPGGHGMILTQRSATMNSHAGQVAFPGGRMDEGETPLEAALREAEEEIGLDPKLVTPVGYLPSYYTGSGYRITPVVGIVDPAAVFSLNPHEVDRVFETPLEVLFDMRRYRLDTRMWEGLERRFYVIDHADAYIWGATAAVIRALYERLSG